MKIKDIFDKEEFEQYISAAINLRNEQKGRLNEMLEIKMCRPLLCRSF